MEHPGAPVDVFRVQFGNVDTITEPDVERSL